MASAPAPVAFADPDYPEPPVRLFLDPGLPNLRARQPQRMVEAWLVSQDLTLEQLRGRTRLSLLVEARRIVVRYLRRHGWSYPAIGRYLQRDHTSIMHLAKTERRVPQ